MDLAQEYTLFKQRVKDTSAETKAHIEKLEQKLEAAQARIYRLEMENEALHRALADLLPLE